MPSSKTLRFALTGVLASAAIAGAVGFATADSPSASDSTTTPIKHVVVLFQENISFDHYFGTYPNAVNGAGEHAFTPAAGTPAINGLTDGLLHNNPNAANPARLGPADVIPTIGCDNNHGYSPEQKAYNGGLADKFIENTTGGPPACQGSEVMNYYDGNTVTAFWNYAQHYALSDNSYGTGFGPSTVGAIELVSGNTGTAVDDNGAPLASQAGTVNNGTAYSNANPYPDYDGCTAASNFYALGATSGPAATTAANTSKNVGDLLNAKGVTWGWFQGGFTPVTRATPDATFPAGRPQCTSAHPNVGGASQIDYDAHHNPFAYYKSTANPQHLPPTGAIGTTDQANHQYDTTDFDAAVAAGALPAVSFVKAPHYQDGHAGYSDPIDEQHYLTEKINEIQASPEWASTAIVIAYDDSDGWYDHQAPTIVRSSTSTEDYYSGAGQCGPTGAGVAKQANDRCGFGPRLPLLVISPYAKANFVDHTQTDQTSILRFIEDNWSLGRIGNGSVDADAGTITNMFDFSPGAARTAALKLDQDGLVVPPPASATPTPSPIPPGVPAPTPKPVLPASIGKVTCKAKVKSSKKLSVTCTAAHAAPGKAALRIRLLKGKKMLATSSASLHGRTAKLTLTTKARISHGKYSLGIAISQAGLPARSLTSKVKL